MTIDEAIAHAREVAEEQRVKNKVCGNCKYCVKGQIHPRQGYCYFNAIHYEYDLRQKACSNWESNDDIGCQCAKEHEQIAIWLEELKTYREFKDIIAFEARSEAIDEFIDKVSESIIWDVLAEIMKRNIGASEGADRIIEYLQKIAEQLKNSK